MNKKVFSFGAIFLLFSAAVFAITLTREATDLVRVPIAASGIVCLWDNSSSSCVGAAHPVVFGNADVYPKRDPPLSESVGMVILVFNNSIYRSTTMGPVFAEGTVPSGGECCDFSNRYALFEPGGCGALGFEEVGSSYCPSPSSGAPSGLTCCNISSTHYEYSSNGCGVSWGATPAVASVNLSYCGLVSSSPLGLSGKLSRVNPDGSEVYTTGDISTYSDSKGSFSEDEPTGTYYITFNGLNLVNNATTFSITADSYRDLEFTLNYPGSLSEKYKLQNVTTTVTGVEWRAGCSTDADCDPGQICESGACRNP